MSIDDLFDSEHNELGFALFSVLSFLLLAAAIVTPLVANARSSALIARNVASDLKNRFLADALIMLAGAELSSRTRQGDFELPRSVSCAYQETSIRFDIQNHAGLIDLNAASSDLLRVGFLVSGFKPETAEKLAKTVERYRGVEQLLGQVASIPVSGGLKYGLFESVDELYDFQASDLQAAPAYRRIFTARTATGTVLNSALPEEIATVLETMPPESAYFVVSGSPPIVAMTLSVSVSRKGKSPLIASAEIGPNASSEFRKLSPLRIVAEAIDPSVTREAFPVSDCSVLFGQSTQGTIRTLIEGGSGR